MFNVLYVAFTRFFEFTRLYATRNLSVKKERRIYGSLRKNLRYVNSSFHAVKEV